MTFATKAAREICLQFMKIFPKLGCQIITVKLIIITQYVVGFMAA